MFTMSIVGTLILAAPVVVGAAIMICAYVANHKE